MGGSLKATPSFYSVLGFLLKTGMLDPRILLYNLWVSFLCAFLSPIPDFTDEHISSMWKWRPIEAAWFSRSDNQLHVRSGECPLTSLGHGFSHSSCKNKPFCLVAIKAGRRGGIPCWVPHHSLPWRKLWKEGRMVASSPRNHFSLLLDPVTPNRLQSE